MENEVEKEELKLVEEELSYLMEKTLKLEDELNAISNYE